MVRFMHQVSKGKNQTTAEQIKTNKGVPSYSTMLYVIRRGRTLSNAKIQTCVQLPILYSLAGRPGVDRRAKARPE